ncbi:MAG: protein-L-isoaspartate(D-aspartate) O-methyltransferase [Deltaproteobacteria bacterium]|nr:protein-L-isoaspartate(D-aspartate) O-methyltransferase [Deltaproteobacteria bacterium]
MVERQIRARGIEDPRLLDAMRAVPREEFTISLTMREAYSDAALPVGHGQTISQPYMVARMIELLELGGTERVLEVGTGLGYQAAILSRLAREVVTIERLPDLASKASGVLAELGFDNVEVVVGDGSLGHAPRSPYDAIVVAAASPAVPRALEAQLAEGGRLVAPVGPSGDQTLVRLTRTGGSLRREHFDRCVFVPLIGAEGY